MEYTTVFESYEPNQVHILRNILEQYGLRCRILKAPEDKVWPKGIKLQVDDTQKKLAFQLVKENGFLRNRFLDTSKGPSSMFWFYVFLSLLLIAIVAGLVARFL